MMKRVIALVLCLLMLIPAFASCAKKDENDLGAYINMYLTEQVYNLDPAYAYNNESALRVVSLVFDNLFVLDENGKIKKSLAKSYEINEDDNTGEYEMIITLKETCWTDGTRITSNDVYYAWTRVLNPTNNFEAASLLYDIKNARAAKEGQGDISIDDVAISAINENQIRVLFEQKIDYDQFLLNLTSYALVPLREDIVSKTDDWAKKPATICSSGPFKLREVSYEEGSERMVLERNSYYFRDILEDAVDKSVTPYKLVIDYTMTDEQIMEAYNAGQLFFVGDIPLSVRGSYAGSELIEDSMSTHTYILNHNAVVERTNGGEGKAIFADENVRKALSLAIDRTAIANAVVFAKAATAFVPYGVYDANKDKDLFREIGGNIIASAANLAEAKACLTAAGITASDYKFSIKVAAYDEVHMTIAEMVKDAWCTLGFNVTVDAVDVVVNDDILKTTGEVAKDIKDDPFTEDFQAGKFEVIAIDYVAKSADAFSVLAPLAKGFSGRSSAKADSRDFEIPTHISGYDSEAYNTLIEKAHAEKNIKNRATILHDAEKQLMDDMAIIPIVFNCNVVLQSKDLTKVKFTAYGTFIFTKAKLKDYELYLPPAEEE